jgi:hypothetical protein
MQPGYPGSGQDPYGQQPQYPPQPPPSQPTSGDPYGQPPAYQDPYAQPPQYQDPYAPPTSGNPYQGYPGPQQQYPMAGYGGQPPAPGNNVMAILALIFGIASIPLLCCSVGVLGFVLGGAGIALGIMGMRKAETGLGGRGMALAGAICGGVGAALGLLVFVLWLAGVAVNNPV